MLNQAHHSKLRGLMEEYGWEVLLLYGHAWRKDFFRYLLNVNFSGPWAIGALSRSGDVRVTVSDPWDAELFPGVDVRQAMLPAADLQVGLAAAIAGLELMEARFVEALGITPVSASLQVEELRSVKDSEEIACIRRACDLADRGYKYFAQVIEPGMAEYELVAEVEGFLKSHGAEDNFMLIASGGTEVTGMKPPTERRFQIGDQVTTELTPQVGGYYAQICRTLVLGEPSSEQCRAFDIFFEAQKAGEDLLKPGVDIADIARVQNDVFRKYGYGEYTGPKYTRVRGHNLGLHPDESPYVLEDVHYTIKEGMVIIAHPNTYLPLSGYMVFGDTLLVTAGGCTPLNKVERKLFQR
jgi:Xaa-Pro aminopeptidase